MAERWPGSEAPITWDVSAVGQPCELGIDYPTTCASVDGYCETRELARYEAADASCLQVGSDRASMLFYRLRADPDVAGGLPVQIDEGRVRATAARSAWRVRHDASGVRTWRVELSAEPTAFPESAAHPAQGAPAAAAWMHHELERRGLTNDERAAFERAWWESLFGPDMLQEQPEIVEGIVEEIVEETPMEVVVERTVARTVDMLLYFLEDAEIDTIARLESRPAARTTHRVFVVRQQL